jgi:hypothetical protein
VLSEIDQLRIVYGPWVRHPIFEGSPAAECDQRSRAAISFWGEPNWRKARPSETNRFRMVGILGSSAARSIKVADSGSSVALVILRLQERVRDDC